MTGTAKLRAGRYGAPEARSTTKGSIPLIPTKTQPQMRLRFFLSSAIHLP